MTSHKRRLQKTFDIEALHYAVDRKRAKDRLTWQELSGILNYGSSGLGAQLQRGMAPSLHLFGAMVHFLGDADVGPYLLEPLATPEGTIVVPAIEFNRLRRSLDRLERSGVRMPVIRS